MTKKRAKWLTCGVCGMRFMHGGLLIRHRSTCRLNVGVVLSMVDYLERKEKRKDG
jgi:hypothetical protein